MLFVEFLQVALGNLKTLSVVSSKQDWLHLFAMAQKQTLIGVCFKGIQRLPPEQTVNLSPSLKIKWLGITANIQRRNEVLNERYVEISRLLLSEGYTSCILKGQGNAAMYGDELSKLRQPGDIDVWVPLLQQEYSITGVLPHIIQVSFYGHLCGLFITFFGKEL